jgi:hypothetical protein
LLARKVALSFGPFLSKWQGFVVVSWINHPILVGMCSYPICASVS